MPGVPKGGFVGSEHDSYSGSWGSCRGSQSRPPVPQVKDKLGSLENSRKSDPSLFGKKDHKT